MTLHIMLVAGEASGDALGARLMRALRQRTDGAVRFSGVGGELMADEGLQSLFPMSDLSVMGLAEVLPRLPRLIGRIRQTADAAITDRPDALVTIDAPSFALRVARRLQGKGIPRIHYVAPQLWAWRPGRARELAHSVDKLLALLPFEPDFFASYGVECEFVGHPVVEAGRRTPEAGKAMRAALGIAPDARLVLALPGSRHSEISRHLPIFGAALNRLGESMANLHVAMVTVPTVAEEVRRQAATWQMPVAILEDREQRFDLFAAADAAVAASGTVSLELALAGVPSIVAYRTSPLTAAIVRRLILVDHVAMPNILAGRRVIPEYIQENCTAENIGSGLERLLRDAEACAEQRMALAEIARSLGAGGEPPSLRAADAVLEVVQAFKTGSQAV
jgi:lipid-A-disaccharide synthase